MIQQNVTNANYSKSRTTFQSSPDHAQHVQLMPTNKSKFNDLALLFISQSPPPHMRMSKQTNSPDFQLHVLPLIVSHLLHSLVNYILNMA